MDRRLINAYDHMTMPDRCVEKLERQLQQTEENRRAGFYTKIMTPTPVKKYSWLRAAAAACLMLALIMGGSVFVLRRLHPAEPAAMAEPDMEEIPWDYYAVATSYPAEKVENFAKIVRHNILQKNWDALEDKVRLPLTIQGEEVTSWETFVEWMEAYSSYYLYTDRLEQETCHALFCNWQGIAMADGLIWINEGEDGLKITAINMEVQPDPVEENPKKQIPEAFVPLLSEGTVKFAGFEEEMRLDDYCAALWGDAAVDGFAVVDMDGDNVCEIVVSVQTADAAASAHLVLRQVGNEISGYPFQPGEILDLKKDGSFFRRDRDYRLVFNDRESWNMWYTEELRNQPEKPLAQWYAYPCIRPDLLLRACEFETGTGWNQLPGIPYFYFESVVQGRASNDLQVFQYWGVDHAVMEDDRIYIFDPDAPGTVVYGTLTEENGYQQFTQLGFYMATGEKEYMAEVRNMLSEEPEYWVDVHLPALGSMGRRVFSPEELIGYLGFTPMPDQQTLQDQQAIRTLIDEFVAACLSADPKAMEPYLAENAQGRVGGLPKDGTLELVDYGDLPDQAMGVGGIYSLCPSAQIAGQEGQFSLYLELVKQPDGWKVQNYRVER